MEQRDTQDRESISLDFTAKGLATWVIKVKEEKITAETINRLVELNELMKVKFPVNVIDGLA